MSDISRINNRLIQLNSVKKRYDEWCATIHSDSLLYQKDVDGSKTSLKILDDLLDKFSQDVLNITNWIKSDSITEFNQTKEILNQLNNSIKSSNDSKNILDAIEKTSLEVFEEFKTKYKDIYTNFDRGKNGVEEGVRKYNDLESKISRLRSQISNSSLDPTFDSSSFRSQINSCEAQQKSILNSCNSTLQSLETMNKKALEILNKGLKNK